MGNKYEEIRFSRAGSLEDAVNELFDHKEKGRLVYGNFNGTILYSDTVTMDEAYKEITGKTKAEHDKWQEEYIEDIKRRNREHEEQIPKLTEYWKQKGREILSKDNWKYWDEIVPIRLSDLYKGMELGNCLDIVKILNDGGTLDEAKEMIYDQGHSGMSFGLVCSMIEEFCERGKEFAAYIM